LNVKSLTWTIAICIFIASFVVFCSFRPVLPHCSYLYSCWLCNWPFADQFSA
jgi:hypothetical protein